MSISRNLAIFTTDRDLVLFDNGLVSGYTWATHSGDAVTASIGNTYMKIHHFRNDQSASANCGLIINQAIDITKYKHLYCNITRNINNSPYCIPTMQVVSSKTMSGSADASTSTGGVSSLHTISLDISSLTGKKYIRFHLNGSKNISFNVDTYYYKVWLSKT